MARVGLRFRVTVRVRAGAKVLHRFYLFIPTQTASYSESYLSFLCSFSY